MRRLPFDASIAQMQRGIDLYKNGQLAKSYSLPEFLRAYPVPTPKSIFDKEPPEILISTEAIHSRYLKNGQGIYLSSVDKNHYILTFAGQCFASESDMSAKEAGSYRWIDDLGELHVLDTLNAVPKQIQADAKWLPPGELCHNFVSKKEKDRLARRRNHGNWGEPAPRGEENVANDAGRNGGDDKSVTMYGTSWCQSCQEARSYMDSHSISYQDFDIESDPSALADCKQVSVCNAVPVIQIGDKVMVGFNPGLFNSVYGSH